LEITNLGRTLAAIPGYLVGKGIDYYEWEKSGIIRDSPTVHHAFHS
jgi:hypothetical protein